MIVDSRNARSYGLSPAHAAAIIVSCALVFMALFAIAPDA
jgi:hypothetical protein